MPIRHRPLRVFAPPILLLAFASGAAAQTGAPTTRPAGSTTTTTTAETVNPPPGYTTTTSTTTSATTTRTHTVKSDQGEREDHARLRIGLEAGLGPIMGHTTGLQVAIIGQLGIQFSDAWAIYYAPSLLVGGAASSDQIRSFVSTGQLGYLALHPLQHLELDAGGGVAIGYDLCASGSTSTCNSGNNVDPVVSGRLAFNLGFHAVRARLGIPLAIHYYGTFLDGGTVSHALMFTIGFLRY